MPSPDSPPELATLTDVARAAGVSIATASRALSGARPVAPETLERVRQAAKDLGYQHNAVASALRSSRTQSVGLVLPRYATVFLSTLIEAVTDSLDERGDGVLLRYVAPDGADHDERVADLIQRRVDGIIVCPPTIAASGHANAMAHGIPLVQVGRFLDPASRSAVSLDERQSTAALAEHLARRGARRAIVVGLDPFAEADGRRIEAVVAACSAHGIVAGGPVFFGDDLAGGVAAGGDLRDRVGTDDVFVCANDDVALGLLTVLRAYGVDVPGQAQVASLMELYPDAHGDPLTSLRHPWHLMGVEAVEMLSQTRRDDQSTSRRTNLAATLVPGASTRTLQEGS